MITLGLTNYRPEAIFPALEVMRTHNDIILEEPHTPGFEEMLQGSLQIETYLQLTDFGFPEYAKQSCTILRQLSAEGIDIYQVDPFMDELTRIHEFFASDGTPQEIQEEPTRSVYNAEREWTSKLLAFYEASLSDDFMDIVRAVQAFARADAARGVLRDHMRAQTIAEKYIGRKKKTYVESGYLHLILISDLLSYGFYPRIRYILEPVYKKLCGKRQPLTPGDRLTWLYARRPNFNGPRADRWAAQTLIYNKIIAKEEISSSEGSFPHAEDEVENIEIVENLDLGTCAHIFENIRRLSTSEAKAKTNRLLGH